MDRTTCTGTRDLIREEREREEFEGTNLTRIFSCRTNAAVSSITAGTADGSTSELKWDRVKEVQ